MIRWNNDYNHGAHPAILEAFMRCNEYSYGGYGIDEWCEKASDLIRSAIGRKDSDVHFLIGGTQVNFVVIYAALRPYESVISPDSGHINVHETGAVENTGHKIQAIPSKDGLISAAQIEEIAKEYAKSDIKEHITKPKLVFISFPTELGTIYSLKQLQDIRDVCDRYDLYLHIDGARLGYGLGAKGCDVTLKDIAAFADSFYIGGTKCGTMFGEAVVISNDSIKDHFRSHMKQKGAMLAKGWTMGMQFYTLFEDNKYLEITAQAVKMAMEIRAAFEEKKVPLYCDSRTNQQFVILSDSQMEFLGERHIFEYQSTVDSGLHCVRFCTSWSTTDEDVLALKKDILDMPCRDQSDL